MRIENNKQNGALLRVEDISLAFGNVQALNDVSVEVKRNEILAVIGPNGSGKTSLLNCINHFYHPQKGKISFNGKDLIRCPSHKIAKLGIARTFQNIELYTGLSTVDNLMAARHIFFSYTFPEAAVFFGRARKEEIRHREIVEQVIDFLELEGIRNDLVGSLPYGMRKRVELGRALVMEPKLLLLDEPMTGMNIEEKEDMAMFILDISKERKIPIVIIEHDMEVVMGLAFRVMVLCFGIKIAEGPPEEIAINQEVIKAYLGKGR